MITLISFIIGLLLLYGSAKVFYERSLNIFYLGILFFVLFVINILSGNDSFHLILMFIIIGASAGFTFKNNKDLQFFIFIASLSITFIVVSNHYYLKLVKSVDILNNSRDLILGIINENKISDSDKKQLMQSANESVKMISNIIPFAYFFNAFLFSFFGLSFLKYIFPRLSGNNIEKDKKEQMTGKGFLGIEKFKVIDYLIFVFLAGWFIVLLVDRNDYPFLYIAGLNVALILTCFYLIQSFGIIKHYLNKKGLPSFVLPVLIFSFFLLGYEILVFVLVILSSIGAIDFWFDFRKLEPDADDNSLKKN